MFPFQLSIDSALELIMQADVYLMNSLKRFCANFIGNHVSQLNAIDLIKLSRMLSLPKLEKTAIEHIAHNLEQVRQLAFLFVISVG